MSLMCVETNRDIMYGEPLYGLSAAGSEMVTAVCQAVIDRLPAEVRHRQKLDDGQGVNVFRCSAGPNFNDAYAWTSFQCGEFLFSVPEVAARKAFPRYMSGVR